MKLPLLLSGPILRRTDPHQVTIWLATSKDSDINVELYKITPSDSLNKYNYTSIEHDIRTKTVQLGSRLYIHLLILSPSGRHTFPVNTLLGYNLFFSYFDKQIDLGDLGLLSNQHPYSITYNNLDYPSFFIDQSHHPTILYGSCRKLHGKGEDALASADNNIQSKATDLTARPSSLFLMGDQIYADDIADPARPLISNLGYQIMRGEEENLTELDSQLAEEPFNKSLNQINGRQYIMEHLCKFTSTHADNHLMTFAEYAAMYLLNWNPDLWKPLWGKFGYDSFENALMSEIVHTVFPKEKQFRSERKKEIKKLKKRYGEQLKDLQNFQEALPGVRRLLANTPTYMIFDDHDITDDWNISREWKENVWKAPLGKQVISNGLTAYWAFQGWGNTPDLFNNEFISTIETYLNVKQLNTPSHEAWQLQMWSFDQWQFVAPTEPKAMFLDTRTMRAYTTSPKPIKIGKIMEETTRSPQLLSLPGWKNTTNTLLNSDWQVGDALFIIAPTPLYGIGLIENFLLKVINPLKVWGIPVENKFDMEAWKDNIEGFANFHEWLASLKSKLCIILSGDVHYGYSARALVDLKKNKEYKYYQFTSSPVKNMSFSGLWGYLMKTAVSLNSWIRKRRNIYRYYIPPYQLLKTTHDNRPKTEYKWKEKITYYRTQTESIVDTNNNIGLLSLSNDHIDHCRLKSKEISSYESISIK